MNTDRTSNADLGVIEGFYGRTWSWQARYDMARFLVSAGYRFYCYAPKADAYLRKRWREQWPQQDFHQLLQFREQCRAQGLEWGAGLSPFELWQDWGSSARQQLTSKLDEILALQPDRLCLLFDDMRGDWPDIASIQAEIANEVQSYCGIPLLMCPTYYSFDPILEQLFGDRPAQYWQQLGADLHNDIAVLWTGDLVISPQLPAEGLQDISARLGRKPVLWDNVIANDGRRSSPFLPLQSIRQRVVSALDNVEGHLINPMNQPYLAQLVLRTATCDSESNALATALSESCSAELAARILSDLPIFREVGLEQMDDSTRHELVTAYSKFEEPCALDVQDWLGGQYRFDPQCLTG
jgi:hypothetical protein